MIGAGRARLQVPLVALGLLAAIATTGCIAAVPRLAHVASSAPTASASVSSRATVASSPATPEPAQLPELPAVERRAVLSALRAPVEKELGQPVKFVVGRITVYKGRGDALYAIASVVPVRPDGGDIDYSRIAQFKPRLEAGVLDDSTEALLVRRGRRWVIVEYRIGPTDTKIEEWSRTYHLRYQLYSTESP